MKVFVDTNVFIDYICKRDQFLVPAKGVIAACVLEEYEIIISSLTIVKLSILVESMERKC